MLVQYWLVHSVSDLWKDIQESLDAQRGSSHISDPCVLLCLLPKEVAVFCSPCVCARSINETHYAAVAGQYYGWSTSYNYLDAYQMQLDTNVLVNGTCLASNDTYDMVVCPSNTHKLPPSEISSLCSERGLPCPTVSSCLPLLPGAECMHMCPALLCCCGSRCGTLQDSH